MTHIIEIPFHIGDFLSSTLHMDGMEIGAYWMLIVAHYQAGECGLPNDDVKLARIARLPLKSWKRIRPTIEQKFTVSDEFWTHSKVIDVLRKIQSKSSDAKAKALKRWGADDATASPQQCHGNANHKPITKVSTKVDTTRAYSEVFEEAWKAYPESPDMPKRNMSKAAAWKKWQAADRPEADLLRAVKSYAADLRRPNAPMPCHMATWLHQQRYEGPLAESGEQTKTAEAHTELLEALSGASKTLCATLTPAVYSAWLRDALIRDGPEVTIVFPNDFRRQYFQTHLIVPAEAALNKKILCRTGKAA